jgi:myosin-5
VISVYHRILAVELDTELRDGKVTFKICKTNKTLLLDKKDCFEAIEIVNDDSSNDKINGGPEDLISLPSINQASILNSARSRFLCNNIYTSLGDVLMLLNPFKRIEKMYGQDVIDRYTTLKEDQPSHIYLIPSKAYTNMSREGVSQSILISGESGAGKTEATKECLKFLTNISGNNNDSSISSSNSTSAFDIANRITAASPILEAFGNAKTIRNPNSSRFGKWMELNFDKNNIICGSKIVSYLLEKSRVTQPSSLVFNIVIFNIILNILIFKYINFNLIL